MEVRAIHEQSSHPCTGINQWDATPLQREQATALSRVHFHMLPYGARLHREIPEY